MDNNDKIQIEENRNVAKKGGEIAGQARENIEKTNREICNNFKKRSRA